MNGTLNQAELFICYPERKLIFPLKTFSRQKKKKESYFVRQILLHADGLKEAKLHTDTNPYTHINI